MVPPAFLRSLAGIIYGVSQLRRENLRDRSDVFLTLLKIESENYFRKWSGRRGSNPQHPAWEAGALPLSYARLLSSAKIISSDGESQRVVMDGTEYREPVQALKHNQPRMNTDRRR